MTAFRRTAARRSTFVPPPTMHPHPVIDRMYPHPVIDRMSRTAASTAELARRTIFRFRVGL